MDFVPINGCLFIQVDDEEKTTENGLLLPSGASRLPQTGTVTAVASDLPIRVGQRVAFLRYAAIDGYKEGMRICKLDHIVGVLDEQTA